MPRHGEIDQHVAQRVRDIRIARGLTQAELGALAGLSTDSITKLEASRLPDRPKHKRSASVSDLLALAFALNVSPLDILLPADDRATVEVARGQTFGAIWVRDWIAGMGPIDVEGSSDEARVFEYFKFAPRHVRLRHASFQHAHLRPLYMAITELQTYLRSAAAVLDNNETPDDVDPVLLADALRRAARSVTRQAETLAAELEDLTPSSAQPADDTAHHTRRT